MKQERAANDLGDPLIGSGVGDYIVREKLGEGGFGAVYRADQPHLQREVVIKFLRGALAGCPEGRQRFLREAQLASRFDHPFAAHVYDCRLEPDGLAWIAMELARGDTLADLLARGPFSPDRFLPFFERLCEVVQAAHEQGIVHRDIKPSNVMVLESGGQLSPKLLDFGIARMQGDVFGGPSLPLLAAVPTPPLSNQDDETNSSPELEADRGAVKTVSVWMTSVGGWVGSPPYMAPEQWASTADVGPAANLYAMGVLVYESLAGRRPFDGANNEELQRAHTTQPVPTVGGRLPQALDAFFQRALAKLPEQRFTTANEMAKALRMALAPPRRSIMRAAALGAVLLVVAFAALWIRQGRLPAGERRVSIESQNLGGPDDAWLGPAIQHMATRRLRDGDRRFSVEAEASQANTIGRIGYRLEGGAVVLTASAARAGGRSEQLTIVRAASVSAALDSLLPRLASRLNEGMPDRGPDPALLAEMKRRGTSSIEAFRLARQSFEGFFGTYYTDSERYANLAAEAVKKDPGWAHGYANLVMLQGERSAAAAATLQEARAKVDRTRDADGQIVLDAMERYVAGKVREAYDLLAPIDRNDPSDLVLQHLVVSSAWAKGDIEGTVSRFLQLSEQRPDLQFGADAALVLADENRRAEIEPMLASWLARAPESEQAHLSQAAVDAIAGRTASAEEEVHRALLLYGEATFRLAPACDVLLAAGKIDEVKRLAAKMLSGNQFDRARGYKRLAFASIMEGRFGTAYEELQDAFELARNQGNEGEILPILETIAAVAPLTATREDRQRYLDALEADSHQRGTVVPAATASYEAALLRAGPGHCPDGSAEIAGATGADRTAVRRSVLRLAAENGCGPCSAVVQAGLSADETNSRSLFRFAVCAEQEGQLRLAENVLRTVRRMDGPWPVFHSILARFHLGRVLARLGQKDAARAELQDFLAHWGDSDVPLPEAEEARRLLATR